MLVLVPSISAQQSLPPKTQYSTFDLIQSCDNSTYSNISRVIYPNGTFAINSDVVMTSNGEDYNYSYSLTSAKGTYIVYGHCDEDGIDKNWVYDFVVNPTGTDFELQESLLYIVVLSISVLLFGLSLLGAIKIKWRHPRDNDGIIMGMNDLKYVKIFLWFMSYALLLFIFFVGWNISYAYIGLNAMSNFFQVAYKGLGYLFVPIFIVFVTFSFISFIEDKKIKKALERGVPFR